MLKTLEIIMIMVMISAAAVTFRIKATSEAQLREVRNLERQIAREEDTIDLLGADWSLLTQPSRIQKLVDAHKEQLGLEPTTSRQVVGVEEIPAKGLAPEGPDAIADAIAQSEGTAKPQKDAKAKKTATEKTLAPAVIDEETETGSVDE